MIRLVNWIWWASSQRRSHREWISLTDRYSEVTVAVARCLSDRRDEPVEHVLEALDVPGEDELWWNYIGPMLDKIEAAYLCPAENASEDSYQGAA